MQNEDTKRSKELNNMELQSAGASTDFLRSKIKPLKVNQATHYYTCERLLRRHRLIGLVLIIFSTISLVTNFIKHDVLPEPSWIIPALSIIVSVLSALITFIGDQVRAMAHQASAIAYGALLRSCEVRVSGAFTESQNAEYLSEFLSEWATISRTSPLTRNSDRLKFERSLEGQQKK